MASHAKISSDPAFLLQYMEGFSCDSKSNGDFDRYLRLECRPVVYTTVPDVYVVEREELCLAV